MQFLQSKIISMKKINNRCLNNNLSFLEIDSSIINILNRSNVYIINDLWKLNRHELKEIGLTDQQINQVIIRLQLIGLDLNKKVTI